MTHQEEAQTAERQIAFMRQLPRRVEVIGRRFHRFMRDGWDINALALIQEDSARLADSCERHGLEQSHASFGTMSALLAEALQLQVLPDPALAERLQHLLDDLDGSVPSVPEASTEFTAPIVQGVEGRVETPPVGYWRRWGDDAPASTTVSATPTRPPPKPVDAETPDPWGTNAVQFGSLSSSGGSIARVSTVAIRAVERPAEPAKAAKALAPAKAAPSPPKTWKAGLRIYHLSDCGPISVELDQRLESQGVEIELLEDADELRELLGALPADLVLVDAFFSDQLEVIGEAVKQTRLRSSLPLLLVALSSEDNIPIRLSARRANVDSLVIGTVSADGVIQRLHQLFEVSKEHPYRILIVEDDRSQALFAEGILRNAGMESMVVLDAMQVMSAIQDFQPEMILMDMHMPQANGIELTAMIREQEAFLHTPIVFLSGENDADRQFDAIEAGGDDFLSKPIRPRHLISAVQGRVRRYRALGKQNKVKETARNALTGLFHRADLIEGIGRMLATSPARSKGGVLFFEIESLNLLRERIGLSTLEQLLVEFSHLLSEKAKDLMTARFGDGTFFLLDESRDDAGLDSLAAQLRSALVQHPFQVQGNPVFLRVSVGICAFRHAFTDSGSLLNAAERIAREARTLERGIRQYETTSTRDTEKESSLAKEIKEALARKRFELLYQPVVAVAGSDDSQYQVLLRMRDSSGRLLSAADVIPVAERSGSMLDIDRWVLLQALELIHDRNNEGRALRLFVTQSSMTLADSGQIAWLRQALTKSEAPGSSLVIELRMEDAALHTGNLRAFCDKMIADGVQFCLSQFQAGPEADALLELLPLGFVKLAHKYTTGAGNHVLRDELKQLIDRAHRRGLEVIGHGVEDAQAAATLWMSGIDFIQGNLVQRADHDLDFDFQQAVL